MPGIVKVGMTSRVPELRIKDKDLCSTGVPTPFVVEYYAFFDNRHEAEKKAHINLKDYSHGKEFFKVDIPTAIKKIECIQIDSIEIYPHKGSSTTVIHCQNCLKDNKLKVSDIQLNAQDLSCKFCKNKLFSKIITKVNTVKKIIKIEVPPPITYISKPCPECNSENKIPEYIKYDSNPTCEVCGYYFLEKSKAEIIDSGFVIRFCPACKSKNRIPRNIKYGSKCQCYCGYVLIDAVVQRKIDSDKPINHAINNNEDNDEEYNNVAKIAWGGCLFIALCLILAKILQ